MNDGKGGGLLLAINGKTDSFIKLSNITIQFFCSVKGTIMR